MGMVATNLEATHDQAASQHTLSAGLTGMAARSGVVHCYGTSRPGLRMLEPSKKTTIISQCVMGLQDEVRLKETKTCVSQGPGSW